MSPLVKNVCESYRSSAPDTHSFVSSVKSMTLQAERLQSVTGDPKPHLLEETLQIVEYVIRNLPSRDTWPVGASEQLQNSTTRMATGAKRHLPLQEALADLNSALRQADETLVHAITTNLSAQIGESTLRALDEIMAVSTSLDHRKMASLVLDWHQVSTLLDTMQTPPHQSWSKLPKQMPVPSHPGEYSPIAAKKSRSIRLPLAATAHLPINFQQVKFSRLETADGVDITMSQTINRGAYKKFRLGVDAESRLWAVLEIRRRVSEHLFPGNAAKTCFSSEGQIEREVYHTMQAHGEGLMRAYYRTQKSTFMVMALSEGTLLQLSQFASASSLGSVAQVALYNRAAYDTSTTLKLYHARTRHVVCDIKPENLLVSARSGVLLTDFGLARAIESYSERVKGWSYGTAGYTAPETYDYHEGQLKSDIFSLGRSLADILMPQEHSPFNTQPTEPHRTHMEEDILNLYLYTQWHRTKCTIYNQIIELKSLRLSRDPFSRYFKSLARYGGEEISHVTLNYLMHPDPSRRWDTSTFADWAQRRYYESQAPQMFSKIVQEFASRSPIQALGDVIKQNRSAIFAATHEVSQPLDLSGHD